MTKVDKIRIFLASPGDVSNERRIVHTVADEINRTIASPKNMVLEVVSSDDVIPSFGSRGQNAVNKQVARMNTIDIFIGIMGSRIGKPTKKAISGTVEEFRRAEQHFNQHKFPEIWFYFRDPMPVPANKDEEDQQRKVQKFKEEIQEKSFARNYSNPKDFEKRLRQALTKWVPNYRRKKKTRRTANLNRTILNERLITRTKRGSLEHPGDWVMIGDIFFNAISVTRSDGKITVEAKIKDATVAKKLQSYEPKGFHRQVQVAFVDHQDVLNVDVTAVRSSFKSGIMTVSLDLSPVRSTSGNIFTQRFSYGQISMKDVVAYQLRTMLLGEELPKDRIHRFPAAQVIPPNKSNQYESITASIFPDLWVQHKSDLKTFLPKAWLLAMYYIRMSHIVDEIIHLSLGPIDRNRNMKVSFKGEINQIDTGIIEFTGDCKMQQE